MVVSSASQSWGLSRRVARSANAIRSGASNALSNCCAFFRLRLIHSPQCNIVGGVGHPARAEPLFFRQVSGHCTPAVPPKSNDNRPLGPGAEEEGPAPPERRCHLHDPARVRGAPVLAKWHPGDIERPERVLVDRHYSEWTVLS